MTPGNKQGQRVSEERLAVLCEGGPFYFTSNDIEELACDLRDARRDRDAMHAIVERIAAEDQPNDLSNYGGYQWWRCDHCYAGRDAHKTTHIAPEIQHEPDCAWVAARKLCSL